PNVEARPTPIPSEGRVARLLAGRGYWNKALRADRLDLFEAFHLPAVIAPDCPTLLTIHDLRPVRPDAPLAERLVARPVLHRALSRAAWTLAVSDTVAAELAAFHPGARVERLYNGVIPADFAAPAPEVLADTLNRWRLPEQFLLAVGHIERRKNLPQLVEALALLRAQGLDRPLVVVGNPGGAEEELAAAIARHGLGDLVRVLHGVSHADLLALYHASRAMVFPSAYEGFGIPMVEAMAAGRPVAASDTPVFRELAGDAAQFFPLGDAPATAAAIEALWSDPALAARLVERGQALLPRFDFAVLADQLAVLYRSIRAS
ncbi:glycosyltransferase family 4 protein, partial [Novosphingobium sp. B 225]|uniref:glycosyltransferase family 4 protein n=1 Tax=Novosphingobium sp. B 225 TaxID=1961849 RepID=UPI000B4C1845